MFASLQGHQAEKISFALRVENMTEHNLIQTLNDALGWELRATNMYAHYAANIRGIHRLQLSPMFTAEATESTMHADIIRKAIVKLGGIPVTERNSHEIIHTTNYVEMLVHSLETETQAAAVYAEIMIEIESVGDQDLYDAIEQIYLAELRSLEELRLLMG
jgi:bacterioferritin